ncbi:TRAP transporter small permease subunit [Cognatishimia sp. F0-27]|uniref:TRAP transporter small permease subunit n=1 Tax=Cognatishimia sp. F0-27 TaxID=2816855 RepID=UPI001D0BFE8A|nr:C4-dicarboxylate ABC transporter permease [Cognatishimia sp. F0-27]MCC1494497.1 C4-dicarboxylate ABC transporter permease [Cognatishimia sp. F0-27]
MEEDGATGLFGWILWILENLALSFYNIGYAITHPASWLDWLTWNNTTEDKTSLMMFVYYGASVEFFFAVIVTFLAIFIVGVWRNEFLWGVVRALEGFANTVGRFFAWAGLLMVLQQVIIVLMQRIFTRPDISIGFGIPLQFDISWFAEELKLYNAMVVCLCLTYTFVQGGHVRVDLVYSAVKFRTKRAIDMFGSLVFMLPVATLVWMYTWFFMWRSLIVPPVAPTDPIERLALKARAVRWNVETIGFSPNGFTGYFLFKILMIVMVGMIFIHAWAFFYRSYLEWKEGPESEGKYLDKDVLEQGEEPYDHAEF